MPITWDSHADAKLLVGLLQNSTGKIDYEAVAKYMGPDCTPIAIKRRIERIKAKAATAPNDGDSSAPVTLQKGKRGRPKKNTKEVAEGEENVTPKKAKREVVKKEPVKETVKKEEDDSASESV